MDRIAIFSWNGLTDYQTMPDWGIRVFRGSETFLPEEQGPS